MGRGVHIHGQLSASVSSSCPGPWGCSRPQVPPSLLVALRPEPRAACHRPTSTGGGSPGTARECPVQHLLPTNFPGWRHLYLKGGDVGTLGGDVSNPVQEVLARNSNLVEHGKSVQIRQEFRLNRAPALGLLSSPPRNPVKEKQRKAKTRQSPPKKENGRRHQRQEISTHFSV